MKKIFLILALIASVFTQNSFAQDSIKTQSAQILDTYYKLKDALVSSNTTSAATNADELIKVINGTDKQMINDDARANLLKDAGVIAQSKDIKLQREKFASLSGNMLALAKLVKLTPNPVYLQYCPMKKASWLSNDKAIRNPYYGNAMLTCGAVKEIL